MIIDKISYFFQHFSGYAWGWWNQAAIDGGGVEKYFDFISWIWLITVLVYIVANVIYFLGSVEYSLRIWIVIPLYIMFNVLCITIISLIGLTIGFGIGFGVLLAIYVILTFIMLMQHNDGGDDIGFFGLLEYTETYLNDYGEWNKKIKNWKSQYLKITNQKI